MSIIRTVKRPHHYVHIDTTCLDDTRLSLRAKGLHSYLMSKPNGWKVLTPHLVHTCHEGRDAIRTALKELYQYGYATKRLLQDADGRLHGWEITIFERPGEPLQPSDQKPVRRKTQPTENQPTENQPTVFQALLVTPDLATPDLVTKERKNPPVSSKEETSPRGERYSQGFYAFWRIYPIKKAKHKAWLSWKRQGLDAYTEEICRSVEAHKAQDGDWRHGFIKHPTTYLNGRCWEDELATDDGLAHLAPSTQANIRTAQAIIEEIHRHDEHRRQSGLLPGVVADGNPLS